MKASRTRAWTLPRWIAAGAVAAIAAALTSGASSLAASPRPSQTSAQSPGVIYVSPSGSDTSGNGTKASPYQTIGYAVSAASDGSTIVVEPGVYREEVTIAGKTLTLEGTSAAASVVADTVIDASGDANGILITGPATAGTAVRDLTVTDAQKAGIVAISTTRLSLTHLDVTNNDQSCNGYQGCRTPIQQETFTLTNSAPCSATNDCEALHLVGVSNSTVAWDTVENNLDGGIYLTDETGPSVGNVIAHDTVVNNQVDCGITLASHNPAAAADPTKGGIYANVVRDNVADGNGAAGILIGAAPPGAAAFDNTIEDNAAENNGLGGIDIHAHAPGQDVSGNAIVGNTVSGNAPDFGVTTAPSGIVVMSAVSPVNDLVIEGNTVVDETNGIWLVGVAAPVVENNLFLNVAKPYTP
jgi:parallel beta-helix repeat protein